MLRIRSREMQKIRSREIQKIPLGPGPLGPGPVGPGPVGPGPVGPRKVQQITKVIQKSPKDGKKKSGGHNPEKIIARGRAQGKTQNLQKRT